jgi:hypothetical protein
MFLNVKRSLHRSQTKPSCTWHVAKQARKAAVKVQIPYPLVAHSRNLSLKQTKAAQAHSRIFLDRAEDYIAVRCPLLLLLWFFLLVSSGVFGFFLLTVRNFTTMPCPLHTTPNFALPTDLDTLPKVAPFLL